MRYRLRFLAVFLGLIGLMALGALVYMLGMTFVEGEPRSFLDSLSFAAETITTTGYGGDHHWRNPLMVVFVICLQLVGVMMVYMVVPLFLIPALEERFEVRLPTEATDLEGHVVIVRHGPAVESLLDELDRADVRTVIIEIDEATARRCASFGRRIILGSSVSRALERVSLENARSLIANGGDEENVSTILAARQLGFTGEILALVQSSAHRRPMQFAGATAVFTPKILLAATLAARASHRLGPRVQGMREIGHRLRMAELRVEKDSPLAGQTLAEADIGRSTGSTVVGQWVGGVLVALPGADTRIEPRGILIAIGDDAALARLADLAAATDGRPERNGPLVVAGYGEVGRKVVELLDQVDESMQVIDRVPSDRVDLVGDVLDSTVLAGADLDHARGVVLALDSDSATLFATVVIRERAPEIPITARVNDASNLDRIHRAGADFALSISQVSGRLLAHRLLGRDEVEIEAAIKITRIDAGGLVGRRLADLDLRARTGCSVVAVERDDRVLVRFEPDFTVRPDDQIYICGASEAVDRWHRHDPARQGG